MCRIRGVLQTLCVCVDGGIVTEFGWWACHQKSTFQWLAFSQCHPSSTRGSPSSSPPIAVRVLGWRRDTWRWRAYPLSSGGTGWDYANTLYLPSQCRYQVTLPKKPDLLPLGDSRNQAVSRYLSNERSITRRNLWEPFQQVVRGYLDLGHAEPVPPSEPPSSSYYLPMSWVLLQALLSTNLSWWDPLYLLKFRCYPVAINADISNKYREVLLHPADKDLHRFVWRASPEDPTGCTECLRGECLTIPGSQDPPEDHGEEYPEVISTVSMWMTSWVELTLPRKLYHSFTGWGKSSRRGDSTSPNGEAVPLQCSKTSLLSCKKWVTLPLCRHPQSPRPVGFRRRCHVTLYQLPTLTPRGEWSEM